MEVDLDHTYDMFMMMILIMIMVIMIIKMMMIIAATQPILKLGPLDFA